MFAWVHSGEPSVRRVLSGSRGFTRAASGSFALAWDHSRAYSGRHVHSGCRST